MTSTRPTDARQDKSPAPAVTRALRILGLLEGAAGAVVSLGDLARGIEAAKSSTSNICQALEEGEMIVRVPGGYRLGRRNVELGGAYVAGFSQMQEFYAFCSSAALLSHEVVQIAVLNHTHVVYLARHEGRAPIRLTASIGSRLPAAPTAMGNALLTTLTNVEIAERFTGPEHFPQLTERSVQTLPDLLAKIDAARERGYAIDDKEVHPGIYGIALVVPSSVTSDQPLAIGTSLMAASATPTFMDDIVGELHEAASRLSNPLYSSGG